MKLHVREFKAMNSRIRRFLQENVEFKIFKKFGLSLKNKDVLEIGCGSGFGAYLLSSMSSKTYIGIDLMPEQIELAKKRCLRNCEFLEMDASKLDFFSDQTKDTIIVFGALHHIPEWRNVVKECYRILKKEGEMYIQEPCKGVVRIWDFVVRWHHPKNSLFSIGEFRNQFIKEGFLILNKFNFFGMIHYHLKKCDIQLGGY